jgi:transposase
MLPNGPRGVRRVNDRRVLRPRAVTIEIVGRPLGVKGFRFFLGAVVERTFAWFGRCRRLARVS